MALFEREKYFFWVSIFSARFENDLLLVLLLFLTLFNLIFSFAQSNTPSFRPLLAAAKIKARKKVLYLKMIIDCSFDFVSQFMSS